MFDIIRFYKNGRNQLILKGITEGQAKTWCSSPKTRKEGEWFDGFTNKSKYSCQTPQPLFNSFFNPETL